MCNFAQGIQFGIPKGDKMTEAIQSDNVKWLIDNTEFNQEKFDESKKRQKEFYDSTTRKAN